MANRTLWNSVEIEGDESQLGVPIQPSSSLSPHKCDLSLLSL